MAQAAGGRLTGHDGGSDTEPLGSGGLQPPKTRRARLLRFGMFKGASQQPPCAGSQWTQRGSRPKANHIPHRLEQWSTYPRLHVGGPLARDIPEI